MKRINNFFFMEDEQHRSNYLWFYGPLIGAGAIWLFILFVTN